MRRILLSILISGNLLPTAAQRVHIVPQPASVKELNGNFVLNQHTQLVVTDERLDSSAAYLNDYLKQFYGFQLPIVKKATSIAIYLEKGITNNKEAYHLQIAPKKVTISASSNTGAFYGVQSLVQLIPVPSGNVRPGGFSIPCADIQDEPRFAYRGLHLDVGRHFFEAAFIKKYIDLMAHYKLNTFHWHLTEDQGWRIEIKRYPRLTTVGAQRKETMVEKNFDPYVGDGKPYGGFYTQEEIKDVVRYAATRHVTIIPEIEMPGHSLAALTAYPELGCTGGPYEVGTKWGIFDDVYCAGNDSVFTFLQNVLDEVMDLFPASYIHIGGDESPKTRWKVCPKCQKRMKDLGLKDEHALQSYFIQRAEKYINSKGRSIIGWDEILEGGLAPNATVMSWRGEEGGIAAAQQHHNVVMTPGDYMYLDSYQADPKTEPLAIGGLLTVEMVYNYEPYAKQLTADETKYVLGAQGNVWTEYITTGKYVEYMAYPRACALAEVDWSPKAARNFTGFKARMQTQQQLLDLWQVNYAKHLFTQP